MKMNTSQIIAIVLAMACLGCTTHSISTEPAESASKYIEIVKRSKDVHPEAIQDLDHVCKALESDFPIHTGMTLQEVDSIVAKETEAAQTDTNRYGFIPMDSPPGSRTYMLGNPHWVWVDIAITDGRVRNLFMIGGNGEILIPPGFKLAGEGPHVGGWAEMLKQMMKE